MRYYSKIELLLICILVPAISLQAQKAQTLCTPGASKEAKALFAYLNDMYGKKILSGQMWASWGYHELKYIKAVTGKQPAIRGMDFINNRENDAETQRAIDWWKAGGIPTIMWHWGAPAIGEGYENSKKAVSIDSIFIAGTPQNKSFWYELEKKADLLEKIRNANVPVLWRPFHELNGNWFWWGKQGPENFKKLWITMYDYLVNKRKLNHLIWVLCYTGKPDAAWYPGKEYVDIAGADTYDVGDNPQAGMYQKVKNIVGSTMPIAYHECGTPPNPDKCINEGTIWSWWMEWHTGHLKKVDTAYLKFVYNHDLIITLDEVPDIVKQYGTDIPVEKGSTNIKLNQLGFYPNAAKIAVVTNVFSSDDFYIVTENEKDTLFTGKLSEQKQSAYSSTKARVADFSSFTKPGKYIVVNGANFSYPFDIKNDVNKTAAVAVLKGYYYQRASMPLLEKFAGKWQRSGFHPDDVVYVHSSAATKERPEGTIISTPGGWYDAGDYNKYIVNSGITMGTILGAYEDFPEYFNKLKTNIPESADAVPDILNEAIYNLRWMLTMQDPNDGGVYNKCTNANFDGMVMPGVTKAKRYVVQKGTAATLDFAAVTAKAGRMLQYYKKQLPGLADSCISAAKKAWQWALLNPAMQYNQGEMNKNFKPAIATGGYGDRNFNDEWLWAAAELFLTTRADSFYKVVEAHLKDNVNLPGWGSVGMMAYYSFLHVADKLPASYAATISSMKDKVISIANRYIEKTKTNAFETVMGQSARDFGWGSNSTAANQGMLLIKAYLLTKEKKYVDYALTNADYLLGRNATGYCFVTGIGSKSPMNPHHRPSTADGIAEPVPGLVAGGPNPAMQDKCTYEFTEPETAYTDSDCSYASNEIAINWNAPVMYLLNAIEALQAQVGYFKK